MLIKLTVDKKQLTIPRALSIANLPIVNFLGYLMKLGNTALPNA